MSVSKHISFASFNLYNLQKAGEPFYGNRYSESQYDEKIDWTAETLRALDADVIGFQELWHRDCLEEAFTRANWKTTYRRVYIGSSWYGIAVAAAVRKPWKVKQWEPIKDFPEKVRADESRLCRRRR